MSTITYSQFVAAVQVAGLPTDTIETFGADLASWSSDDGSGDSAVTYHNLDSPWNQGDSPFWEYRSPQGRGGGKTIAVAIARAKTQNPGGW